jgi:hypothetical protein
MTRDDRPRVGWQWSKKSPARAGARRRGIRARLGWGAKSSAPCVANAIRAAWFPGVAG